MEQEQISVIMPIYNLEHCLDQAIQSVMAQTYQNIEILLINDGSTDNSSSICNAYADQDHRIRVVQQKNSGVSMARNTGLGLAQGQYICFVDGDDWIEADMLRFLYDLLHQHRADLAMCGFIEENENQQALRHTKPFGTCEIDRQTAFHCYKPYMQGYVCAKLFRRAVIEKPQEEALRFEADLQIKEDTVFLFSYILRCGKIITSSKIYYHYIVRSDSAMRASFGPKNLSELEATQRIIELLAAYPRSQRVIRNQYIDLNIRLLMNMLKSEYRNPLMQQRMVSEIRRNLIPYLWNPWSALRYRICGILLAIHPQIISTLYGIRAWWRGRRK